MFERYIETDDFLRLPLSGNRYRVNCNGIVTDITGNKVVREENALGHFVVKIDWWRGFGYYELAEIIAHTFKPLKMSFTHWKDLRVLFKDGNVKNIHPSNLVWKFPVAYGSVSHSGFAFIPMFSRYMINKEGAVFDTRTKKIMNSYANRGYYSYSLIPDIGPRTSLKRHRGICLAFTDYPPNVDDLQVNHKNGKCGDDRIDNLEWVTDSENRLHAITTGLTLINKPVVARDIETGVVTEFPTLKEACRVLKIKESYLSQYLSRPDENVQHNGLEIHYKDPNHATTEKTLQCPIVVRDLRTGEITEYESIVKCALSLGISKHVVNWRISMPTSCLYPDYKQLKRKSDQSPWYIPVDYEKELLEYSWSKAVLVRNTATGIVTEYETQRIAAEKLGIAESTIHVWLSSPHQPVFKIPHNGSLIQLKNKSDPSEWRVVDNPEKEYNDKLPTKVVLVKDIVTGVVTRYASALNCAQSLGITTTNLNWRLKSKGQKVYAKHLLFKYEKDPESFIEVKNDSNQCDDNLPLKVEIL